MTSAKASAASVWATCAAPGDSPYKRGKQNQGSCSHRDRWVTSDLSPREGGNATHGEPSPGPAPVPTREPGSASQSPAGVACGRTPPGWDSGTDGRAAQGAPDLAIGTRTDVLTREADPKEPPTLGYRARALQRRRGTKRGIKPMPLGPSPADKPTGSGCLSGLCWGEARRGIKPMPPSLGPTVTAPAGGIEHAKRRWRGIKPMPPWPDPAVTAPAGGT